MFILYFQLKYSGRGGKRMMHIDLKRNYDFVPI